MQSENLPITQHQVLFGYYDFKHPNVPYVRLNLCLSQGPQFSAGQ